MLETETAPGVHRVEDAFTNFYLIEEDGRLTVVDTGVRASWSSLRDALPRVGRSLGDVEAVVLTHAHFDHLGFAERARRELDVPVWVHEDDVPLTRHPLQYGHERSRLPYLLNPKAMPIMAALVRARAFWPPPVREVRRYRDGTLDVPGRPRVVPTPGHTLGHCALHLRDRDAVLAGDALVLLDPYTGEPGPRLVARAATADSQRAHASLGALAATGARTVLTGHGPAWHEGADLACQRAAEVGAA
jgi:glyoxylase-like metal-dependent hydrolase (beta-lactamase superfamily II)